MSVELKKGMLGQFDVVIVRPRTLSTRKTALPYQVFEGGGKLI